MMKNRLVRSLFKKNPDVRSSKEMKIHFLLFTAFIKNGVNCGNILKTSTKPFAVRDLNQVISVGIPMTTLNLIKIKWDTSLRWSRSLYCSMWNPDQMTIGKTHPTLFNLCYPVLSDKISSNHADHHEGILNLSNHDKYIHELNIDQFLVENFLRWGSLLK